MKVSLSLIGSAAASAAGTALDVLPRWTLLVFVLYVITCGCILLGLFVARDVRNFRSGE